MQQNHILKIFSNYPINKQTAIVVSQSGCQDEKGFLSFDELVYLIGRIERKHRLLKRVLGIKTKAQHTNLTYAFNKRRKQFRQQAEPRAFAEYIRCGAEIRRLQLELAVDRKCRQMASKYSN